MGIIQQQSIRSTIYTYAGVLLGFVTVALLFPRFLTPEQIGVINLLVAYAMVFGQLGTLGFSNAIVRFFPYFRNKNKGHHGFLSILLATGLAGFILFLVLYFIIKPYVLASNVDSSPLFIEYYSYIIPLTFFLLYFTLLETYSNVLYNTTTATFLKEFLQRMLILISLLLFVFNVADFNHFLFFYCATFAVIAFALLFFLRKEGELQIRKPLLKIPLLKGMFSISAFGFITGFSHLAIMKIDVIMLNQFYSSAETGIYATTFYFGTLIILPSRTINRIASTVIADAFKTKNIQTLRDVYLKSCVNQYILGSYLLLGIWLNIDNIFKIIPPEYEAGKYVIFFIGMSNLIRMTGGIDTALIGYSKYYKYNTLFIFLLLFFSVITNLILIPILSLTGAAIASTISVLLFVIIKFVFIKKKFDFQPYNIRYVYVLLISLGIYFLIAQLPAFSNPYLDVFVRGCLITGLFVPLVYLSKASSDVNKIIEDKIFIYFKS